MIDATDRAGLERRHVPGEQRNELDVAGRSSDRRYSEPLTSETDILEGCHDIGDGLSTYPRIANDPALAHAIASGFELRFDQEDPSSVGRTDALDLACEACERDERQVAHHEIEWWTVEAWIGGADVGPFDDLDSFVRPHAPVHLPVADVHSHDR